MSEETLKTLATAHLLATVIKQYLDDNVCEFINPQKSYWDHQSFSLSLLDRIIIVGGAPRDILLNRPINDLDIVFNLRELCKLQLNHLRKYHLTPEQQARTCKCVYFQHYLRKFNDQTNPTDFESDLDNEAKDDNIHYEKESKLINELVDMHNCSYIFNAKFILNILKRNQYFVAETSKNKSYSKLSIQDSPQRGWSSVQIISKLVYHGINLDGCQIDMIDSFDPARCISDDNSNSALSRERIKLFHRQSRELSMREINLTLYPWHPGDDNTQEQNLNHDMFTNTNSNLREGKQQQRDRKNPLRQSMEMFAPPFLPNEFDFDEHNNQVPLYDLDIPIYSLRAEDKLAMYDFSINCGIIPLSSVWQVQYDNIQHWKSIIQNGLDTKVCDSISDITLNHILRAPRQNFEQHTIHSHEELFHFWQVVRFHVRLPYFQIDEPLINAHIREYKLWLNVKWFSIAKKRILFFKRWKRTFQVHCKNINDVQNCLDALSMLKFHSRFRQVLTQSDQVRNSLSIMISKIKNKHIENVNVKVRNVFTQYGYSFDEGDNNMNNDDLTMQLEYSIKETNILKTKISDLEKENQRLLQEMQIIQKSKIESVSQANQTLNQMREYVNKYHQALQFIADHKLTQTGLP